MNLKGFLETHFSHVFHTAWSEDQERAISTIEQVVLHDGWASVELPRGCGATSIMTRTAVWTATMGHSLVMAVVGRNCLAAKDLVDVIESGLRDTGSRCEQSGRWVTVSNLKECTRCWITGVGAASSFRGLTCDSKAFRRRRPDIVMIDQVRGISPLAPALNTLQDVRGLFGTGQNLRVVEFTTKE